MNAGIFRRHYSNNYYYPVVQQVVIEEENFIVPQRVTQYKEVPGVQFIEDQYGKQLVVINGKIRYAVEPVVVQETEVVKNNVVEEVNRVEIDQYGNKTIVERKFIRR